LGQVNRVRVLLYAAGGKANNLARAFQRLGGQPLVLGIAAGHWGKFMLESLEREGIGHEYVSAEGEGRLTTTILANEEQRGATTVLLEPGQAVPEKVMAELAAKIEAWAPKVGFVVLT